MFFLLTALRASIEITDYFPGWKGMTLDDLSDVACSLASKLEIQIQALTLDFSRTTSVGWKHFSVLYLSDP